MTVECRPDVIEETPLAGLKWRRAYVGILAIFCIYRWLSKTPSCKNFNEELCSGYFWTLETSCLMNVSFFHVFVYIVLEQLGIGGSSRVVTVIG
jgi:hypothetical protein